MRTLIIGDTHGHYDRLACLLYQEGILADGPGDSLVRVHDPDVHVIQLGDITHCGADTQADDREILHRVLHDHWVDDLLWGNHDRAGVGDKLHTFNGFREPFPETVEMFKRLEAQGRLKFAAAADGFLITHAGAGHHAGEQLATDPVDAAHGINALGQSHGRRIPLVDAVSHRRGGDSSEGGILWRDMDEMVSSHHNQIFGHSAQTITGTTVHREEPTGVHWYNLDIGGKSQRRLAGIWLPDETIVRVELDSGRCWEMISGSPALAAVVKSASR